MPMITNGQPFNTVWRLHCDARAREYTLTVEYYSNLPPAKHEEVHDRIRKHALQLLEPRVPPGEGVKIVYRRLPLTFERGEQEPVEEEVEEEVEYHQMPAQVQREVR
jgi:hypothetical protein